MRGIVASLRQLFGRGTIRYRTMFGTAKVYEIDWDGKPARVLDMGGTYQSATYLDDGWCNVPFPYLALYDHIFEASHPVHDVCMLGGGGYAYPKHLVAHHPTARIDVVEIDAQMTRIAREQFFLDRLVRTYRTNENGRLGIVTADARTYLEDCAYEGRRYDAILNDCFVANSPDASLATKESSQLIRACLHPGGLYLTNVITAIEGDDADPLFELVGTLASSFGHIVAFPCDRTEPDEPDNVVVLASDQRFEHPSAFPLYDGCP